MITEFTDGDFSALMEVEGGRKYFPFLNEQVQDANTRVFERIYELAAEDYAPLAPNSKDPVDNTAYIVAESEPAAIGSDLVRVVRRFARIPANQIGFNKVPFNRPSLDGVNVGAYYGVSFDGDRTSHIFSTRKTVGAIQVIAADTKSVTGVTGQTGTVAQTGSVSMSGSGSETGTVGTSGSIAQTGTVAVAGGGGGGGGGRDPFDGSETVNITGPSGGGSFNCLDSAAHIASVVIGATGSGPGFCTVIATPYDITVSLISGNFASIGGDSRLDFGGSGRFGLFVRRVVTGGGGGGGSGTDTYNLTNTPSTTDTHSLSRSQSGSESISTLDTANLTNTSALTETYAVPASLRYVDTSGAHSAAVGDHVAFFNGPRIVARSIVISVLSTTRFTCPQIDIDGKDFAASTCVFSSGAIWRFVNGVRDCSVRNTQRFYLPGITPGIATGADVPQVTTYADPIGWFAAVIVYLAGAGAYAAISSTELASWMGPILQDSVQEIQMSDALESRGVSA